MSLQSLRQALRNRFQRWTIHNLLPLIFVCTLWICCLRLFNRLEPLWVSIWGPNNVHLENLPAFVGPDVELGVQEVGGNHGIAIQRHLFDERTSIEHGARWRADGCLAETIVVRRRFNRGLYLMLENGVFTYGKRLEINVPLPKKLNRWEEEALKRFRTYLHGISPPPPGRRYGVVRKPSFV